uniref:Uncharacterized protein n=1 Tax=Acrobeloides nanus TaxID=290746 RepID=A0A914CVJ9_9BILA
MRVNSKKAAVYELNKQGRTVPEIAKLLNMDRSNVMKFKRTQTSGQIADHQRTGDFSMRGIDCAHYRTLKTLP